MKATSTVPVETVIRFTIPLKTVSAANERTHWGTKAKRVAKERKRTGEAVLVAGAKLTLQGGAWAGRIIVTLTRVSPRLLDVGDNLPASLKGVRDELARLMGVDDRDSKCCWVYGQRKGEPKQHAVEVEVRLWP